MSGLHRLGLLLAIVFLLSSVGFVLFLVWWLIAMLRRRDPRRPRRLCLIAAALAVAALALNSLL